MVAKPFSKFVTKQWKKRDEEILIKIIPAAGHKKNNWINRPYKMEKAVDQFKITFCLFSKHL